MNIKIFNVVRTQLNNETLVWSFPSFSQAQEFMFAEVASEIKIDKDRLASKDVHFVFNGYDVWKGNDYVTISDGNGVEYEIKQTTMDAIEIKEEAITDEVIVMYPACKKYRSVIMDTIKSFGVYELPFFNTKDIRYFIDNEVEEALAMRAAQIIVSDYDEGFKNDYFQTIVDYLEGNRGFSVMLAVINGEEDAIEDVKREINKEQGKDVFKKDYVWVWESKWYHGLKFDFHKDTKVFCNHDAAYMEMSSEQGKVLEVFRGQYIGEDVESYEDKNGLFKVKNNYDLWEGRISKIYIQD